MRLKCCSFSAGFIDGLSTAQINWNESNGSRGADLRLLLTAHRGGEIREEKDIRNEENPESSFGCRWGESSWLLSLFLGWGGGGDYGTMHLPAEAATRCYDLNTTVWRDDWLRGEAGVVEGVAVGLGWGGVARHFHIPVSAEAPLKFKYLSKLEIDPFL